MKEFTKEFSQNETRIKDRTSILAASWFLDSISDADLVLKVSMTHISAGLPLLPAGI